ncbi:MAG: diaminopimelate epimerase [Succinivibrionaceae bacterium]|nr:diaminopimelate epimerase [Succinivibrionaceae bacterium]
MRFTKMQGCGNDYVYINGAEAGIPQEMKSGIARRLSDRHFGVGGDGVIFINPSEQADFEMEMYNADGSRGEMCGNGIRCVAAYVYGKSLTDKKELRIVSGGRIKRIWLDTDGQDPGSDQLRRVNGVRVDMEEPILEAARIPVKSEKKTVVNEPIEVEGKIYRHTCVSMGNPHAVVYVDDADSFPLDRLGRHFENHPSFPKRVNTEFVQILDRRNVKMRVWERGTGETFACGTGACATAVAGVLNGCTDHEITVHLLGGDLKIRWDGDGHPVYMTGPAEFVFEGEIELSL